MAEKPPYKELEDRIKILNSFILNSPGMVYSARPDWTTEVITKSEDVSGYSIDEFNSGKINWMDIIHPADKDWVINRSPRLTNGKKTISIEYRIIAKDGSTRWVLDKKMARFSKDNTFLGVSGLVVNITERKKIEIKLRASEIKYKGVFNESIAAIYIFDTDKNFIDSNQAGLDLLGYSKSELLKMGIPDVDADPVVVLPAHNQLLGGDRIIGYEHRLKCKDGKIITVLNNSRPLVDSKNNVIGMLSTLIDITERIKINDALQKAHNNLEQQVEKRTAELKKNNENLKSEIAERKQSEEALQQSEDRIQSIFRSAPVGIGVVVNRTLKDANKRLCDMVGYSLGELVGQSARILYHCDEDFDYVGREKYDQIRKHGTGIVETQWRRKDGSSIAVLLSSTPIDLKDLSRDVTFSALDITDRKEAEKEQEKLQRQLAQAQKMESVGKLAGGIAHDFNNMLSVILGNAEIGLKQADPAHPLHSNLMEIQKAAQRSADVTRQLLAFARRQTITPKVLDLNKTVKSMVKMLRRLIGEDINLTWLPATNQLPVRMDPSQIDQILANLCVNARDAIAGVGKIIIEAGKATFDEAYCSAHPGFVPGDFIQLTVSDDGCGMDKEILGNLFEPFFTTKDVDKGTGLGLATVYGIIKQNRGFINVYSEPAIGTIFKVYLPRHEADGEQELKKVAVKPDTPGSETILLVEDEPAILEMTAIMLKHMGYTILTAGTPGEAINLAREHSGEIHLLITDVVMPEMNGRDLAGNLLSMNPNLKRLFMSGYTVNVIAHHGVLDEGVNFIQKPFSINDLSVKVREVLDEAKEKG